MQVQCPETSTGLVYGMHKILELTSDMLASRTRGSFTTCSCWLGCFCVFVVFLLACGLTCSLSVVWQEYKQGQGLWGLSFGRTLLPGQPPTDNSFKWHSFQGNWSSSCSCRGFNSCCIIYTCTAKVKGLLLHQVGSMYTTYICVSVLLINKRRMWMF